MKLHRPTFILLLLPLIAMLCSVDAAAQNSIDNIINKLERQSDVETTYSERRTPKKHKLYRITQVLNFTKAEYYKQLERAFENERSKTVSAVKNKNTHTYKFEDDKGTSTYTLSSNGNSYTLVKSWRSAKDEDGDDMSWVGDDLGAECTPVSFSLRSSSRNFDSARQRELRRNHRDIAKRQKELAKRQRELARRQHKMAEKHRKMAEKQRRRHAKAAKKAVDMQSADGSTGSSMSIIRI